MTKRTGSQPSQLLENLLEGKRGLSSWPKALYVREWLAQPKLTPICSFLCVQLISSANFFFLFLLSHKSSGCSPWTVDSQNVSAGAVSNPVIKKSYRSRQLRKQDLLQNHRNDIARCLEYFLSFSTKSSNSTRLCIGVYHPWLIFVDSQISF